MLFDYHVHTGYSNDSVYPLRQVALDAIRYDTGTAVPPSPID